MGWWGTGYGDDIIGDGPADTVMQALKDIAGYREERGREKPTLPEVLDAVLLALLGNSEKYLDGEGELTVKRLIAKLDTPPTEVSSSEDPILNPELVTPFQGAFEAIASEYEDTELERKPRLSELLTTIAFVLGSDPEDYLAIAEGKSVKEIIAK
ncbi:MAG TPA: hypothetical protein VJT71_19935 [Pyrinomonadaceae bacterium]|nr:hypothetical protein [Pyrinomonadaceae bacterium]